MNGAQGTMLRHVEPSSVAEPLLVGYEDRDEDDDQDGGMEYRDDDAGATEMDGQGGTAQKHQWKDDRGNRGRVVTSRRRRRRPLRNQLSYRSGTHCIVLRQNDLLIKVMEDEDDENFEEGERKAVSVVMEYGACGLAACGHSPFWKGLANILRVIYAYFYWNWTIIFASLAFCTTVSLVYEAWLTGTSHGQAAVVIAVLPSLNLIWIIMMFTWHVLCWGVWTDFHDLESALQCIKRPLQSQALRTSITVMTAVLVNVPVLVSFLIFAAQVSTTKLPEWMWQFQFWLSLACNLVLAFLFFLGSLIGKDHTPEPSRPPPPSPTYLPRSLSWLWRCLFKFLYSDIFQALRVYGRSAFVEGGAFNEDPSMWGRHAADFTPEPVDLEDDHHLRTKYSKRWPTPWYLGWYCRSWLHDTTPPSPSSCPSSSSCRSIDRTSCFRAMVVGPWATLLLAILTLLAVLSWSVRAYAVLGIVGGYFLLLPAIYSFVEDLVIGSSSSNQHSWYNSRTAEMVLDIMLLLFMVGGYVSAVAVASMYLGGIFIPVIILANLANLMFHLPAIRHRDYPPPKDHRQSIAFHCKAVTHTIINSARAGAFVTILLVLALVLAMRTVPSPSNLAPNSINNRPTNGTVAATQATGQASSSSLAAAGPVVPYAFCSASFSGLSVLHLAYISNVAYYENMTDIKREIDTSLPSEWDFSVSEVPLAAEAGRAYLPTILELRDDKAKVLVYATRGTDEVFDIFQDLDAWCEALVIQTASYIFPLYGSPIFQPYMERFVGTTHHLVQALSSLKDILLNRQPQACSFGKHKKGLKDASCNQGRYYYNQLYDYVETNVVQNPSLSNYSMIFTGHSLGGGVAQIVGARLERPAVTFSAPGVVLSRRKFGISLNQIDKYLINIVPQGDLVPLLDSQGVKQQFIRCEVNRLSVHCHSLTHTITVIEESCGNGQASSRPPLLPPSGIEL